MAMTAWSPKGGHQTDLGLRERPHLLPVDHYGADDHAFLEQRYREEGTRLQPFYSQDPERVTFLGVAVGEQVRDVHRLPKPCELAEATVGARPDASEGILNARLLALVGGHAPYALLVLQKQAAQVRIAKPDRLFEDGLEHRLHVGRRGADDLENPRRRRLLFERLLGLVEQARVLDRDHRLVGKGAK
jgi:hypothetical protein